MKIDASLAPTGLTGADTAKRSPKAQAPANQSSDVQLSLSGRLQSMETRESSGSPVDSAKVAAIKQAIAEGRFTINAGAIADSLISSAQELLGKQSRA